MGESRWDAPSGEMAEQRVRLFPPNLARNTCFGAADSFIMPLCPLTVASASAAGPPGPPPIPSPSRHTSSHLA